MQQTNPSDEFLTCTQGEMFAGYARLFIINSSRFWINLFRHFNLAGAKICFATGLLFEMTRNGFYPNNENKLSQYCSRRSNLRADCHYFRQKQTGKGIYNIWHYWLHSKGFVQIGRLCPTFLMLVIVIIGSRRVSIVTLGFTWLHQCRSHK